MYVTKLCMPTDRGTHGWQRGTTCVIALRRGGEGGELNPLRSERPFGDCMRMIRGLVLYAWRVVERGGQSE
jgi:hypothetical protein